MSQATASQLTIAQQFRSWNTRDVLVTAVISMVFGILLIGLNYLSAVLMAINPFLMSVLSGIYFLHIIAVMYIVRRPGAAMLTQMITQLAIFPFNPFGLFEALVSIAFAAVCEFPFLITRYRDFHLPVLLVSGALAGLLTFAAMYFPAGLNMLDASMQLATLVMFLISSTVLGGWLAQVLANAVAKAGVLNGFAITNEQREGP